VSLSARFATLQDLVANGPVLAHAYGSDPDLLCRLPEAWERLGQITEFRAGIIEELTVGGQPRPSPTARASLSRPTLPTS
jgi:hypothetical protein